MKSMALGPGAEIFEDGGLLVGVCIALDIIVVQFRLKRKLSGSEVMAKSPGFLVGDCVGIQLGTGNGGEGFLPGEAGSWRLTNGKAMRKQ